MSEYTPITGELRDWFEHAYNYGTGERMFEKVPAPWFDWKGTIEPMLDAIDSIHAQLERENAALKAELDRVLGEQEDKALTYEEAKQLCMKAFDGGATYGSESMRYGVNARAYDWEHWLEKHESLFKPTDTWERILHDAMAYAELPTDMDMQLLVSRCKALCERTKEDA